EHVVLLRSRQVARLDFGCILELVIGFLITGVQGAEDRLEQRLVLVATDVAGVEKTMFITAPAGRHKGGYAYNQHELRYTRGLSEAQGKLLSAPSGSNPMEMRVRYP